MQQDDTGPTCEALLLTCFDFRLLDAARGYMAGRGLAGRYDHISLAGASLGALNNRYPAWSVAFRQQLDLAVQLHRIRRVIILDHRDCAAYRLILGEDLAADPAREREVHASHLAALRSAISTHQPSLSVELLLMSLAGAVEPIA